MNYFSIKRKMMAGGGGGGDYFTLSLLCYSVLQNTEAQNRPGKPEVICRLYV